MRVLFELGSLLGLFLFRRGALLLDVLAHKRGEARRQSSSGFDVLGGLMLAAAATATIGNRELTSSLVTGAGAASSVGADSTAGATAASTGAASVATGALDVSRKIIE